jgi:Flp pilus assembly protein TadD
MSSDRARRRRMERQKGSAASAASRADSGVSWRPDGLVALLLVLLTLVAFVPTLQNGFLHWDDDENFLHNPDYRGLSATNLGWMFTTFHMGHYIPLTWMTLGLDYLLWGMNPLGYHLTSLLLHAANGVLFYLIALSLLRTAMAPTASAGLERRLGAILAAAIFAVHPLRVESVAWATERRDVLSGLFYLSATLAYLHSCATSIGGARRRWYWRSVALFALALLSKSMAVSLPIVLLILDVYPLRRLSWWPGLWHDAAARRVLAEKVPFLLLSLAASTTAFFALTRSASAGSLALLGWLDRLAVSVYAIAFYLWKTAVPVNLSPLYELPVRLDPTTWPFVLSAAVVLALTASAIFCRRRWPALTAVWLAYVVILLPVLGIVQNGVQIAADRYTYLSCLGWALLAGSGFAVSWNVLTRSHAARTRSFALAGLAGSVVIALAATTWNQAHVWHDSDTLWAHALSTSPSSVAHASLGALRHLQGQLPEAIEHYRAALRINPRSAEAHMDLGSALATQGQVPEGIEHLREALRVRPNFAHAHVNLGRVLAYQGQLQEAVEHYRAALRVVPDSAETHADLGDALVQLGQTTEAVEHYRDALRISPGLGRARRNLDRILKAHGPSRG